MRKNVFKLMLVLGAVMLLGFSGCTVEVNNSEPVTPKSYAVGISEGIENGSVSADRQTAQKGQTVTLTLAANAGYKFGSISVKDASNNSVETATVTAGTKYMFSMPESNVTVSATFTPVYAVGISEDIENGSVSADRQTAQKDETVTLTLSASEGYELGSLSVKDASNNSVDTTVVTAGIEYTFVMPESDVTVSASFTPESIAPTSYAVSVSTGIVNGSVSTDKQTAQKGQTVTLTLAANAGYRFDSISIKDATNNSVDTTAVTAGTTYTFVMPESNVTVNASFTPKNYTVGILSGIENGSVSTDRQTAQKGQTVTLTVSANEGYGLGLISVKDASNNTIETRTVTTGTKYAFIMPESDVTVSASFTPKRYAVGILAGIENGSVIADKLTAQKNEAVTLTLSAGEGYELGSISVKDSSNNSVETRTVTAGTKYTFVMPESNVSVNVSFTPKNYTVGISAGIENGSVIADKLAAQKNEAVTLMLSADEGYELGSLSVKDASNNSVETATVTAGTKYIFVMPESNVTVSATFIPKRYTVGISAGIVNGGVSANKLTAQKNETVTLTLSANAGYKFDSISVKDASNNSVETATVTAGTEYTFVMPESNVTVNASFTPKNYTVGILSGIENGSVSADRQTAQKGQTVTLTLSAREGYELGSISVKDSSNNSVETATVTAGTKYIFVMPEKDVTVNATFRPMSYAVSVSTGIVNGSVSTDKQTAQKGQTVTLTLAANAGYRFDSISIKDATNNSVDTTAVTAGTTYTFVMPESSVTVNASFTPRNYTVGISAGIENGSVIADRQTAQKGQTVTLTVSSNEGYGLGLISVKDASNNSIETRTVTTGTKYAFIMPESDVTVSATFTPKRYAVGILSGIENGSVRADKLTAKKNETVTLTLSAREGYELGSLSVKDSSNNSVEATTVATGTKYTFVMFVMPESDVTVSATFIPMSYAVSVSTGIVNGSVSADRQTAQKGQTVTLTLTANAGYKFGSVSVKDASNNSVQTTAVTAGTEYTFVMPEDNVTVSATFDYEFNETMTVLPVGTSGTAGTTGTYVLFGYWPQTIKADSVEVDETKSMVMGSNTYYKGSDGAWYAKIKETAYGSSYKYSNGTDVAQNSANSYKYFKVEPIKWRVLTDNYSGKRLLLAENILDNHRYAESNIYVNDSNNYANSEIREYLNGTFWNTAFTDSQKSMIDETDVDNSAASTTDAGGNLTQATRYACGTTKDKIFLLSEKEATTTGYGFTAYNVYGTGNSRIRMTTDFAKASGVYTIAGYGGWWRLRSPRYDSSTSAYFVCHDGSAGCNSVGDTVVGVCPALTLKN